jgi:hypothetical protein
VRFLARRPDRELEFGDTRPVQVCAFRLQYRSARRLACFLVTLGPIPCSVSEIPCFDP